ncbi:MAG: helix-turn-helix transcriptional regulator [Tepidisphaeraceae bacterium]
MKPRITGTVDALTVDNAGAAKLLGISESHLYALKRTGRLGPTPVRLGRCCRFLVRELSDWCEAGCPSRSRWQVMKAK